MRLEFGPVSILTPGQKVFKPIHDKKSSTFFQLWALGRLGKPEEVLEKQGHELVSASDIPEEGSKAARPLTREDIKEYVQDYVQAAKNAIAAGTHYVEIHAANGFLLDQYLHEPPMYGTTSMVDPLRTEPGLYWKL
jgi:NADPH2 dehydrogenase